MTKIDNKRDIVKKRIISTCLVGTGLLSLAGCSVKNEKTTNAPATTEITSEANIDEVTTEATNTITELDINDNLSIEYVVEESYNEYRDFYDECGISKDQVRDIVFVLNDKYTDEDGKLIIDEDRADEAYMNIKKIEGQSDNALLQKIDNINTIKYAEANPDDEQAASIAADVKANNDWKINKRPTLVTLIDKNISGGKATIEEIKEWEAERDYQIDYMNANDNYDIESINNYVIDQEIDEYNRNTSNMNNINKNGQKYVIAVINFSSLNVAAKANPQTIYLEGYTGIDQNIKINPTNDERFLENDVITTVQQGLLDSDTFNAVLSEAMSYSKNGYSVNEIEKMLLEKYAINNDKLRLVISYAHYLTTMANQKYLDVECDENAETKDDINVIRNNTVSLNQNVKKLVLS